jgi:hypothetical protein
MAVTSPQDASLHSGRSGALATAGLATAVVGLTAFVALVALAAAGSNHPPGWAWLASAGLDYNAVFTLLAVISLAFCVAGLIIGGVGWARARRRSMGTRRARLAVFLSLVAPVAVLAWYVFTVLEFFYSWPGPA